MSATEITVRWSDGNGAYVIEGGGLGQGLCWDQFEDRQEAIDEARKIAEELDCVLVLP